MSLKTLFSTLPHYWDDDYVTRWWNKCYEYDSERVRFICGDLCSDMEREGGGHYAAFEVSLHLAQEDIPEFYLPDNPKAEYDIHYLTVMFWRWGVYLSVRGKVTK